MDIHQTDEWKVVLCASTTADGLYSLSLMKWSYDWW